jgi:hypothetical protein
VWLICETVLKGAAKSRLADAGLSSNQNDLALPALCALPAAEQKVEFVVAANHLALARPQGIEATGYIALLQDLAEMDRRRRISHAYEAEIAIFE